MEVLQPSEGTTLKILVHFEVEGHTMDDCDFKCSFYSVNKLISVVKKKSELIRIDENNYVAIVDTEKTGIGLIKCKLTVEVPDSDCPDGIRKEVARASTNVTVLE